MKVWIDHLGIAVQDVEQTLTFFRDVLGLHVDAPEEVASQRVRAHFLHMGPSSLELLEATAFDSPIAKFVEKRGPGMHHVAYQVDDLRGELRGLAEQGVQLIDEEPHRGLFGLEVAFVHPDSVHGVLAELVSNG